MVNDNKIDIEWSGSSINFGQDAWDDSTILDIFDSAIKSHKTKKDKKAASASEIDVEEASPPKISKVTFFQSPPDLDPMSKVAVAGSWSPVTASASTGKRIDASMSNNEGSVGERGQSNRNGHSDGGSKSNSAFLDYLSSDGAVREKEIELQRGKGLVNKDERAERTYRQNVATTSSSVPQEKFSSSSSHFKSFPPEPPSRAYNQAPHDIPYNHQYEQQQYEQQQHQPHRKGDIVDVSELEDSFNGMLMAWYHSGYATGRYQTLLEVSKKETIRDNSQHNVTTPPYPEG